MQTAEPIDPAAIGGGESVDDDVLIALIPDELQDFGAVIHNSVNNNKRGDVMVQGGSSGGVSKETNVSQSTDDSSSDETTTRLHPKVTKTPTRKRPRSERSLLLKEVEELQQMVEAVRRKRVATTRPRISPSSSPCSRSSAASATSSPCSLSFAASPPSSPCYSSFASQSWRTNQSEKDDNGGTTRDRGESGVVSKSDPACRATLRRQIVETNRKLSEIVKLQVDATALQLQMAQLQSIDLTLDRPVDELEPLSEDFDLDWIDVNLLEMPPLIIPQVSPAVSCESSPPVAPPLLDTVIEPGSVPFFSGHDKHSLEADQARLMLLLEKIESSYQLVDEVFYKGSSFGHSATQPLKSTRSPSHVPTCSPLSFLDQIPDMQAISSSTISTEPHRNAQISGGVVNLHSHCAELVDNRVVPYDADVLIGLLYKCFGLQARMCCDETYASQMTNEYLNCVLDNVIHTKFSLSVMLRQIKVRVRAHSAMCRYSNVIVFESVGVITPDRVQPHVQDCSVAQMEYTRTAWCRVESLGNGFSVVRYVTRLMPTSEIGPLQMADPLSHREEQLHILLGLLQRGQQDTLKFFAQVIGSQSEDNLLGAMSMAAR